MLAAYAASLAFCCLLASWLCDINPQTTYSWSSGLWHGLFFVPNLVLNLFDGTPYKACLYTGGYNACWWVMTVAACASALASFAYWLTFALSVSAPADKER